MNIALLSYEYPPDTGFGGIGTYTYYHARALVKLGHAVHVFAGALRPGTFDSEMDGVRVTRVGHAGWLQTLLAPAGYLRWFWFRNRVEAAQAAYAALRAALGHERFDVVEAPECGADAALVSLCLPIPLVVRFHSPARLIIGTYDTPPADRRLTAWIEQVAIDRSQARTACSRFLAGEVTARMGVREPIDVIPNGIDLDLFDADAPGDARRRFQLPLDAPIVLFANRLEVRKGVHLLPEIAVRVMQRVPAVHFAVAGRDLFNDLAHRVWPAIRAAGLESRFHALGPLPLHQVRALLRDCDVFLLPSLWENCPYSCIEAMAASRAVVASDCGGIPELVQDGETGLLARTGEAASFASALERLLDDGSLRARLGSAARQFVSRHLVDTAIAERTVAVYARAIGATPRAGGPAGT